jgi:membrane protease YdiL (CAAX protease family)
MTPTWIDHALVLCFAVFLPIRGAVFGFRRLASLPVEAKDVRLRFYRSSLVLHAALMAITLVVWGAAGREWAALGLAARDPGRVLVAIAAAFVMLALHYWQGVTALQRPDAHTLGPARLGRLDPLMPRTRAELDAFLLLLVVAGCGEEILFRGYLTAYLASYLPLAIAAVVSVLAFALGHLYQGARGVAQTAVVGGLCMVFYLATGSLWPAIILHAGLNFVSAHIGHALVRSALPVRGRPPQ